MLHKSVALLSEDEASSLGGLTKTLILAILSYWLIRKPVLVPGRLGLAQCQPILCAAMNDRRF
jgi:hypothetical protein